MLENRSIKVCVLLCLGWAAPAWGQSGWEVHYQTTFADGSVRDLNAVPTTKKNIRRVVRISRMEDGAVGYKMLSTGAEALTIVRDGHTVKDELAWNGKAWVARSARSSQTLSTGPKRARDILGQERHRVKRVLAELRSRLVVHDHEVAQAQRGLAKASDDETKRAFTERLAKATQQRDATLKGIELYQVQFKALGESPKQVGRAGRVSPAGPKPQAKAGGKVMGLNGQIANSGTLPHKQQVWKLPPGQGNRTYSVEMAHPEAGPYGAFHYVAYADINGDSRPDKLIARSPLATATSPGEWTNWQFTTSEPAVFVGNAWNSPDTNVYYDRPPDDYVDQHWSGLSNDVYVSGLFYGVPNRRHRYAPYLSNIRVHVSNPFGPGLSPSPRIVIK